MHRLTDEVAQVHRSPGFITSNLVGCAADGSLIKEFEASHGTVADLWNQHLRGEPTSFNPLGMAEALMGAMQHSGDLQGGAEKEATRHFVATLRRAMHNTFRYGHTFTVYTVTVALSHCYCARSRTVTLPLCTLSHCTTGTARALGTWPGLAV